MNNMKRKYGGKEMKGLELECFQIISAVGTARSFYIEAIQEAKKRNFKKAEKCIKDGEKSFTQGHLSHAKLIQQEASDTPIEINLLLVHAEDQLMSAEAFHIIANEFIDTYKCMFNDEEQT